MAALVLTCGIFAFPRTARAAAGDLALHNPYASVDFASAGQYKANLHTHTTESDGAHHSQTVFDKYAELGYDFLALTDHDVYKSFDARGVTNMHGIVGIPGNEYSGAQHVGSLFNTTTRSFGSTSEEIAAGAAASGGEGRFVINHPGRNAVFVMETLSGKGLYSAEWFAELYLSNSEAFGMEVYNQQNRYPNDRIIWDRVLIETLPTRAVWAVAADDNHGAHYGYNAVIALLQEEDKTPAGLRDALDAGAFFATSFVAGLPSLGTARWDDAPAVDDIIVDAAAGTITIEARNCSNIQWITGDKQTGTRVIAEGADLTVFNYKENTDKINKYVRPLLINQTGEITCETIIQPFAVARPPKSGCNAGAANAAVPLVLFCAVFFIKTSSRH